jgi:hypothetical protein
MFGKFTYPYLRGDFISIWFVYRRFTKYSGVLERENNKKKIWSWVQTAKI